MLRQEFDRFRSLTNGVSLPKSVRDNVLEAARTEGPADAAAPRHSRRPAARSVTRRTALRVGTVAAGSVVALLGLSILGRPEAETAPGNYFVLKAYADGTSQDDGSVLLSQGDINWGGGGGDSSNGWMTWGHDINFACEGVGIDRIDYRLEGGLVGEVYNETCVFFIANANRTDIGLNEVVPEGCTPDAFSVSYEEQDADKNSFTRGINTCFRPSSETQAAREASDAIDWLSLSALEEYMAAQRAQNAERVAYEREFANLVSQVTLAMTVTYENGDTQTKRYAIGPRENFDQVYADYLESGVELSAESSLHRQDLEWADWEARYGADVQAYYDNMPSLYVISELDS